MRGLFDTLSEFKAFIKRISDAGASYIHSIPIKGPGARMADRIILAFAGTVFGEIEVARREKATREDFRRNQTVSYRRPIR